MRLQNSILAILLLTCSALGQSSFSGGTIGGNILPDTTGRNLGSASQQWNAFLQNLTIYGNITSTPPSVFTNTANNCGLQSMLNGASMAMFSSSGLGFFTQDAVCGGVVIPLGATVSQVDGVTGMVENHSDGPAVTSGPATMGGYFQTHNFGSNTVTWGINTVGLLMTGANNSTLQNEVDFDVQTGVAGSTVYGLSIQSPYLDSNGSYWGVYIGKPGCTTPDFVTYTATGCPQYSAGFTTIDGAAPVVLSGGTNGTGNNHGSQAIQLSSVDSGGIRRTANIATDPNGNLDISPASSSIVVVTVPLRLNGATSGFATLSATATGSTLNLGSTNATVTSGGIVTATGLTITGAPIFKTGTASNTDVTGELSFSGVTTASYTWANSYTSHPECSVTPQFDPSTNRYWVTYTSTTSFTINFSGAVTGSVGYVCAGRN